MQVLSELPDDVLAGLVGRVPGITNMPPEEVGALQLLWRVPLESRFCAVLAMPPPATSQLDLVWPEDQGWAQGFTRCMLVAGLIVIFWKGTSCSCYIAPAMLLSILPGQHLPLHPPSSMRYPHHATARHTTSSSAAAAGARQARGAGSSPARQPAEGSQVCQQGAPSLEQVRRASCQLPFPG